MSKLLLIGWDAADWRTIRPLIAEGKMPHLKKLMDAGVHGNIATLSPPLSPMLWTSIATGKRPDKHGIYGFSEPDPHNGSVRPITNLSRKTKAIWNILNQSGKQSHVIGWWPSHPVEPINGVMVSNHYQRAPDDPKKPWPIQPGTIHPERLIKPLAKLRMNPRELGPEHILPFVPKAAEIDQKKDRRLSGIAKIIADCTSIHAAATATMQLEPWDFMAVYYDAIDHFGHGFMKYHPPRLPWINERDFELYQGVIEAGYRYHDMMLGTLLKLAGEETTVILMSDHGFHPDNLRPEHIPVEPAGPAEEHRHYGIFVMKGPDIKQGEAVHGASLLDVCPTILTHFDLPIGQDMDGKPLVTVFKNEPEPQHILTWDAVAGDDACHSREASIDPRESQEALKQLEALGYIDPLDDDKETQVKRCVRELNYNLARAQIDAQRFPEATKLLEALFLEWPEEFRFGIQLVRCYQQLDRITEARLLFEEIIKRKKEVAIKAREELKQRKAELDNTQKEPQKLSRKERYQLRELQAKANTNQRTIHLILGQLLQAEGKHEEALQHIKQAEQKGSLKNTFYNQLGQAYLNLKQWDNAFDAFKRALQIEPDNATTRLGLARALLQKRRNLEAASEALASTELIYQNAQAHLTLGIALQRCRKVKYAIQAFEVSLSQNPNLIEAHRRLAHLYNKHRPDPEKVELHRNQIASIKKRARARKAANKKIKPIDFSAHSTQPPSEKPKTKPQALNPDTLPAPNPHLSKTISIVTGLPRSGTSMIMQMLNAGGVPALTDGQREADTDNPKGYFELELVKGLKKDNTWLKHAQGRLIKVVIQLIPHLPSQHSYKFVFIERDIDEVITSQTSMLKRLNETGANLSAEDLKEIYQQQIRTVKHTLAQNNHDVLYLQHRQCIEAPTQVAEQLNDFYQGILDPTLMSQQIDPSLHRNRKASE